MIIIFTFRLGIYDVLGLEGMWREYLFLPDFLASEVIFLEGL